MIPLANKEQLIKYLEEGYTIVEACTAAQVSKATLYRLFKAQLGFKKDVEDAIFKANDKSLEIKKVVEARNMEQAKLLIKKRGK